MNRIFTPLLALLLLSSCAALKPRPTPVEEPLAQMRALDEAIAAAETLYVHGQYSLAADMLRRLGQQGYSYYRTDDVLYWLGLCDIGLEKPDKAARCFDLLRRNYSRAEFRFPDLPVWENVAMGRADSMRQMQPPPEPEIAAEYSDQPLVSNTFFETDIRQALADIGDQAGVPIVPDPMVQGYVTLNLNNVPLEKALGQMLAPLGLIFRKMEGYYLVGQPSPDSPSFPTLSETRQVKLKFLKVSQAKNLLPKHYSNYLNADDASDIVTITAPPPIIDNFLSDLAAIDVPQEQFVLEVLVVEIGKEARRELGLDWDWTGTAGQGSPFTVYKFPAPDLDSSLFAEIFYSGVEKWGATFDLRLALKALATGGKAQIRANPRVTTQRGREATIRIGKELYYSIVSGPVNYPYVTLEKIATGITLKITPYKGDYSEITNDLNIEVTDVTGAGANNLPVTSVRSVDTKVTVANGQSFGIGGLVLENTRNVTQRIPFLGDIPYLGAIFGHTKVQKEETEVIVLVTPHVLINPAEFDDL